MRRILLSAGVKKHTVVTPEPDPPTPPVDPDPPSGDFEIKKGLYIKIMADTVNLPLESMNISVDFSKNPSLSNEQTITGTVTNKSGYYELTLSASTLQSKLSGLGLTESDTLYYKVYIDRAEYGIIISQTGTSDDTKSMSASSLTSSGSNIESVWYNSRAKIVADKTNIPLSEGESNITVYYSYTTFYAELPESRIKGKGWFLEYNGSNATDALVTGCGNVNSTGTEKFRVHISHDIETDQMHFLIGNSSMPSSVFDDGGLLNITTYDDQLGDYSCTVNVDVRFNYSIGGGTVSDTIDGAYVIVKYRNDKRTTYIPTLHAAPGAEKYTFREVFQCYDIETDRVYVDLYVPPHYGHVEVNGSVGNTFENMVTRDENEFNVNFDIVSAGNAHS